jgi:hypothetical protein
VFNFSYLKDFIRLYRTVNYIQVDHVNAESSKLLDEGLRFFEGLDPGGVPPPADGRVGGERLQVLELLVFLSFILVEHDHLSSLRGEGHDPPWPVDGLSHNEDNLLKKEEKKNDRKRTRNMRFKIK